MNRLFTLLGHLQPQRFLSSWPASTHSPLTTYFLTFRRTLLQGNDKAVQAAMESWKKRTITPQDLALVQQELSLGEISPKELLEDVSSKLFSPSNLQDSLPLLEQDYLLVFNKEDLEKQKAKLRLYIKIFSSFLNLCTDPKERERQVEKIIMTGFGIEQGFTLLHTLAQTPDLETIKLTLRMLTPQQRSQFLSLQNKKGETPLVVACESHNVKSTPEELSQIISLFLEAGANPLDKEGINILNDNGIRHNIIWLLTKRKAPEALRIVLAKLSPDQRKELINAKDSFDHTAFSLACNMGDPNVLSILIENGADLFHSNNTYKNVIHMLVLQKNASLLQMLLQVLPLPEKKVLINAKDDRGNSPLSLATESAYEKIADILIEHGASIVDARVDASGNNILHKLVKKKKRDVLHITLTQLSVQEKSQLIHAQNDKGETPSSLAIASNDLESITILIEHGASIVDARIDASGNNILHKLVKEENLEFLERVIAQLSDKEKRELIGAKNSAGQTPLFLACSKGDMSPVNRFKIVSLLIQSGANLLDTDDSLNTLLHILLLKEKSPAILALVLTKLRSKEKKLLINAKNKEGATPLALACQLELIEIRFFVFLLIENGANFLDVDVGDSGNNILHQFAKLGNPEDFRMILSKLSPNQKEKWINAQNDKGQTPLSLARGHLKIITILIENGANLLHIDHKHNSILHVVPYSLTDLDLALLMQIVMPMLSPMQRKELINSQNKEGITPLFEACKSVDWHFIDFLIQNGANPTHVNQAGYNILHMLAINNNLEILRRISTKFSFEQMQELLGGQDLEGNTPLLLACQSTPDLKCIDVLIENGALLTHVNHSKNNILHLSINRSNVLALFFAKLTPQQKQKLMNDKNINGKTPVQLLDVHALSTQLATLRNVISLLLPYLPTTHILRTTQDNMLLLCNFVELTQKKLPIFSDSALIQKQVNSLFEAFARLHPCDFDLLYSLRMNPKLALDPQNLQKLHNLYQQFRNTRYQNSILIAIQTCTDMSLLEHAVKALSLSTTYDKSSFLALSLERQKEMMSRFVVFRDRGGLALASSLIKEASTNPQRVSPKLITLALELIEKTQILPNPDADQDALIDLIWALLSYQETDTLDIQNQRPQAMIQKLYSFIEKSVKENGKQFLAASFLKNLLIPTPHPDTRSTMQHILSSALSSFVKMDTIRFTQQFRSGIFHIFTLALQIKSEKILLSSIKALGLYSYDLSREEDKEIIRDLTQLAKEKDLSLPMQRELALVLSTICEEEALLTAWKLIQGPAWDHYQEWEGAHENLHIGTFDLFTFYPSTLHENRENMRAKIFDLLGEYNKKECLAELNHTYEQFQKSPSLYPRLQLFEKKLKQIPSSGVRFLDPLFLPANSVVFRGIGSRKGEQRAYDAILDLLIRGVGDSELTKASAEEGTWSKIGQLFFALDVEYARTYTDSEGAFLVIDGDFINTAILRRGARQQKESDSMHYVLYDTVGHEHIKAIYVSKRLKEEILLLRNGDIKNPPTQLKYFSYLSKEELVHFMKALKHDPYQICSKLKTADLSQVVPVEPETSFAEVIEENLKREISRQIMEKKYASEFSISKEKLTSKL